MRLIETFSLKWREFVDDDVPQHAILSHRRESSQEVTFEEFQENLRIVTLPIRKYSHSAMSQEERSIHECIDGYLLHRQTFQCGTFASDQLYVLLVLEGRAMLCLFKRH